MTTENEIRQFSVRINYQSISRNSFSSQKAQVTLAWVNMAVNFWYLATSRRGSIEGLFFRPQEHFSEDFHFSHVDVVGELHTRIN